MSSNNSTLEKAMLVPYDAGVPRIQFMFNPTELTFESAIEVQNNSGAQTKKEGQPKSNFSRVKADKVTIGKIIFDTYESGESVVEKYIKPFIAAVRFSRSINAPAAALSNNNSPLSNISAKENREQSPPIYRFVWGEQIYLRRCFLEKLNYKLTMFLPDGTPVRAVIDSLSLQEVDEKKPSQNLNQRTVNRQAYKL
jgi:hypothetical protein